MELQTTIEIIVSLLGALAPYAWPLVVLLGLLLFRRQLGKLVERVENAKLPGGSEVLFKKELEEAEQAGRPALPPAPEPTEGDAGGKPERNEEMACATPDEPVQENTIDAGEEEADDDRESSARAGEASRSLCGTEPGRGRETSEADGPGLSIDLRELASISPEAAILMAYKRIEQALSRVIGEEGLVTTRPFVGTSALRLLAQSGRLSDRDISILGDLKRLRNIAAHHQASDLDYEAAARYLDLVDEQLRKMSRLRVVVRNNAVVAGAFPTGGPWVREGHPILPDGEYEIVRYADRTWRLLSDRNAVVFKALWTGA